MHLFCCGWRRWIIGELLLAGVGALHFQFIKEKGRADDALRHRLQTIFHVRLFAGRDQTMAQSACVEIAENRSPNQFLTAVLGRDSIEQAWSEARTQRFHKIAIGQIYRPMSAIQRIENQKNRR